jgi:hypothetical protein
MAAINLDSSLAREIAVVNRKYFPPLAENRLCRYIARVNRLTKHEVLVLVIIAGLLLTGLLVKYYRASHPAAVPVTQR